MKCIFIIAPPRSGTNLLRDLLSQHPIINTWPCDELNLMWKYNNINKNDDLKIKDISIANKKYIRNFFYKFYIKNNKSYILEKTCANSLRIDFVKSIFKESFFIFIKRNKGEILRSAIIKSKKKPEFFYIFKKFLYVPHKYKIKYLFGYLDYFIKIFLFMKKEPTTWGPKINLPKNLKNQSYEKKIAFMINKCIESINISKTKISNKKRISINYEDLVKKPDQTIKMILNKINPKLLNDYNLIYTNMVDKSKLGKGKKYLKYFK